MVRELRKNTFRLGIKEARVATAEEENSETEGPEQVSEDNLERDYALDDFLQRSRSRGVLPDADYELLLKFHWEGFEAMELRDSRWRSAKAVHRRLGKILNRFRRIAADSDSLQLNIRTTMNVYGDVITNQESERWPILRACTHKQHAAPPKLLKSW